MRSGTELKHPETVFAHLEILLTEFAAVTTICAPSLCHVESVTGEHPGLGRVFLLNRARVRVE